MPLRLALATAAIFAVGGALASVAPAATTMAALAAPQTIVALRAATPYYCIQQYNQTA